MKRFLCVLLCGFSVQLAAQTATYKELYRPQFHFTPAKNWINDPNGLVYYKGQYHMFYQHNPFGNQWGHMTWGHATSTDLVHWKHQPIAIPEANGTMIFSGTCVADVNKTSDYGKNGKTAMVAIYTGHQENINQSQHAAFSLDDGKTWTKAAGNPILDLHKKDFRDPKVFWYAPENYWVMCVMFPVEHLVQFYSSPNLKDWTHQSDFGPAGDTTGVWECPDLTEVPVYGEPGKTKWVLQTSQNASMQYFVGDFDGKKFTNENPAEIARPDYGPDYYAAICYGQLPKGHAPTAIGWMNNWNYANDIPTTPWKGTMSLPRTLSVKKENDRWVLLQQPVAALQSLRGQHYELKNKGVYFFENLPLRSQQCEIIVDWQPSLKNKSGVQLGVGSKRDLEIGYDPLEGVLYIDRIRTPDKTKSDKFYTFNYFTTPVKLKDNKLKLHIFFDHSVVEVFANDGEVVMSAQFFPDAKDNFISLFGSSEKTVFNQVSCWPLKSIWKP